MTIKNFFIEYNTINEHNTFTSGDVLTGSFTVLPGQHLFPFMVKIPSLNMPSFYKGECGKVQYILVAQLRRSMHMMKKARTKFAFVSRTNVLQPEVMSPQYGTKERDVIFFASGKISMNIFLEKTGYQLAQPERLFPNMLSIRREASLPKRHIHTSNILKEKDTPLSSSTRQTVSKVLNAPSGVTPSILNCRILKVEYRLKVILDVSFPQNPDIKLPLIFLPTCDGELEACQHHRHS
ncbi:hypothetical protein P4O66_023080 [Electrophorus voltai]|uniref:Arrestin C-terminal-like domain-containing protein n=1 Tax=Electrophorus voltai TaxID=2609070 RepID=A0AAD8ZPY5_9TELE|nr:hypothetical protein P4O66_023080 [Electrophorus voltai]